MGEERKLVGLLSTAGDTRQQALDAVLAWLLRFVVETPKLPGGNK